MLRAARNLVPPWGLAVGALVVVGLLGLGLWRLAAWQQGIGEARVQARWDAFMADLQKQGAKAQAQAQADEAAALARNTEILNGLQKRIADSDARGAVLAQRLRLAEARPRACPVSAGADQPAAPAARGESGPDTAVGRLLGRTLAACMRDGQRLDALIAEIVPQMQ